ncbi:hypothetical protein HG536_0G01240 [Torulaspora globosa]|uniref:Spindle pole body component SPC42 n=1 Tax=Torulaspora globosa TaxID=48254 RepID=A0A7G3ZL79_9SACH|nr:uncharacterized protein HG536_0G01240 [Torulaspora globosa]QLL34265.1 hypothetical protein HG536_0G01240 [Torulaspora globosa]
MNISPTPRRYASRSKAMAPDNAFLYSDPVDAGENVIKDRIIPEEYRLNSQMINRLIKQNKELITKIDAKQEEIDRLNILVGSLRGKLIKYTEMNKKLEDDLVQAGSRVSSRNMNENEQDYIQVPKRRTETKDNVTPHDDRINALSDKLDKLTKLVLQNAVPASSSPLQSPQPPVSVDNHRAVVSPSEEDIMCKESLELKQMEDQIDSLKRKLLIKRENELRKISLNQELLELMDRLSMQNPAEKERERNLNNESSLHNNSASPAYCAECHHHERNHNHVSSMRQTQPVAKKNPQIPASDPLETPTPLPKRAGLSQVDLNDTVNRIW